MDPFLERLLVAFVVGGGSVALFTAAAERLGSRVGGLLLSLPVKVGITLVLVALNEGPAVAAAAAAAAPGGLAANVLFLGAAVGILVRGHALPTALAAGVVVWLAGALLVVAFVPPDLGWTVPPFLVAAAVVFAGLSRAPPPAAAAPLEKPPPGLLGVLGRAVFAGIVVAASVAAARAVGPAFAGVMSVFPSGFLTSIVILQRARGVAFLATTARTMAAGLVAPAVFLALVALTFPAWSLLVATLVAVAATAATSALVGATLRWTDGSRQPA